MPRKALVVSVSALAVAACLVGSLTILRGTGALAETAAGYPSVSTQLFDATPIGGEVRTLFSPAASRPAAEAALSVKAQIFDPDVFGDTRSKFSGTRSVANSDESQSTIEGRSVGTPLQAVPVAAPVREMSPGQPRECEPRPSARKAEPQFGSLELNRAAG